MFTRRDASNTGSQPSEPQRVTPPAEPTPAPQPAAAQFIAPTPQPAAPAAPRSGDESLVAREDTFEGQLRTTRGVRVLGTVRGGIESEQYVHIEENADVEADITAQEVVIAGTYSGKLNCRQRVEIRATGRVSGQIETAKLLLHEGGYFDGELHMQKPTDVAPAAAAATKPDTEESRPRRTRYVDLSSDSSSAPREVGATDSGSNT